MMKLIKKYLQLSVFLILFPVILIPSVFSQASQMLFEHFSDEKGLINNQAMTIYQDRQGFMWFGTMTGLSRYDGYEFVNYEYDPDDSNSLTGKIILDIKEDSSGYLWIATNGGLNKYDLHFNTFTRYTFHPDNPYSIIENHVNCIEFKDTNTLWLGLNKGIQYLDRTSGKFVTLKKNTPDGKSLVNKEASDILITGNQLWVVTRNDRGFFEINIETEVIKFHPINGFQTDRNKYFCKTNSGRFFILQGNGLVVDFRKFEKPEILLNPEDLNNKQGSKLFQAIHLIDNELWIGTNSGLFIYDMPNNLVREVRYEENNPNGISSNNIQSIFKDRCNSIWLASLETGIDVWHREKQKFRSMFHRRNDTNSLSAGAIFSIIEDEERNIWLASDGYGINKYNTETKQFRHYVHDSNEPDNSISNNSVLAAENYETLIFMGHWAGGITIYNTGTNSYDFLLHNPEDKNSLPSNNIWHMTKDSKNRLIIATMGAGISFYDIEKKQFNNYNYEPDNAGSLNDTYCYFVYEDKARTIWIGTAGHGLNRYDPDDDRFIHYLPDNSDPEALSHKTVRTICEDSNNRFWIGTEAGLNLMERKKETFKKFYKKDGLSDNSIRHIVEGTNGDLWITTSNGLSRLNPEENKFTNYGVADGLLNKEFMPRSGCLASDGYIYLGGRNGVNYFHPDSMKINQVPPKVVFTGLKIYNQPVFVGDSVNGRVILDTSIARTRELRLTYKEDIFSVSFTGLHFLAPKKNLYKYKLEGYNDKWIRTDASQRFATFTNLSPGHYILKVQAANNDGIWNEEGASLIINITPPWWKTWWFRIFFTIFVAMSTVSFYFYRINLLKRQKKILEEKVNERTAELSEANVELEEKHEEIIQQQNDIIEQNKALIEQKKALERVSGELDKANQSRIRFFMNVSHEFRTPLTLILGPVENLMAQVQEKGLLHQLQLVYRNAKRLLRLTNQLLDLRKLETGTMKLHATEGDVIEFIHNIYASFQYLAKRHKIKYTFEKEIDHWNTWFDEDILEKILYNLLSNAFKYTPDGKSVSLSLRKRKLRITDPLFQSVKKNELSADDLDYIELKVKDEGIGIHQSELQNIFNRFYMVENSDFRKKSGTGIGLALTKELIELHHGDIRVVSKKGEGTEFFIRIILDKRIPEVQEIGEKSTTVRTDIYPHITDSADSMDILPHCQQDIEEGKPTILIVDDNADIIAYISKRIHEENNCICAFNGQEAFKAAVEYIPDIIISDVMMPVMDGIEFSTRLKADERTSHIPVILLTAKAEEGFQVEGLETGADDYITKPFNLEVLMLKIANIIKNREKLIRKFHAEENSDLEILASNQTDEKFLARAKTIIEKNIGNSSFNAEEFAKEIAMSRAQLYRKIQALTSQSVNEFIRTIRLKKAKLLLKSCDLTISEMAYKLGFNSPQYFTKCFKDQFGISPSEFIQND